jgi:putative restriction endonuclease
MTPLKRALIEKAGHDHGFEHTVAVTGLAVTLGSARHPAKVEVTWLPEGYGITLMQGPDTLPPELARSFGGWARAGDAYVAATDAKLAQWLQRAAALAQSLPNQAAVDFDAQVQQKLAALPPGDRLSTEVQRLVRQRVGQDRYRQAMLEYWGGACAVTGLTLAPALRASHAKPWADCTTDAEQLDVFNGFLLSANLDTLFDKFLISFTDEGELLVSSELSAAECSLLGLDRTLTLRCVALDHLPYLSFHRSYLRAATSRPSSITAIA